MSYSDFFEFTAANMVNGQARVLYSLLSNGALTDVPVPQTIADIIAMLSPYDPVQTSNYSPWDDIGGTSAPPEDSRQLSMNEWKVQQQYTAVLMVPNEIVHTVKIPAIEVARADILQLFENGGSEVDIDAVTDASAQVQQWFGQFTDLNLYRVAIIGFAPREAGVVYEGSSDTVGRARMFCKVFHRCSISAENVSLTWEIGQPLHVDVTLRCYVEPGQDQNQEYGSYLIEDAGTIATS